MAVNRITNKQVVNKETINRGTQVSTKNDKLNQGNSRMTVNPGKDFTKNYSITLKDIDTAVLTHIKDVIKPKIKEANEIIQVPILWANEERWKNFRKRGVMRDKNNSLILPLMMIKRNDISFNDEMPMSFKNDLKGEFISVERGSKWSKTNRYDRFSVQNNINPVRDMFVTGMPDFVVCNYTLVLFTNYMEQMNFLNELFLEHLQTYWGNSTSYKFLAKLDGSISNISEMNQDGERLIKNELGISLNGYVIPEHTSTVIGTKAQLQKRKTVSKVIFGYEGNATDEQVKK